MTTFDTTDSIGGRVADSADPMLRTAHPSSRRRPDRLTVAAGWSAVTIAILHTAAFAINSHWGAWLAGPTRTSDLPDEAITVFWALPGGFVVPLAVLGILLVALGRRGQAVPRSAGWILLGWIVLCLWIIGPSGFLLGLVPTALLLWPRRSTRQVGTRGSARRAGARPA